MHPTFSSDLFIWSGKERELTAEFSTLEGSLGRTDAFKTGAFYIQSKKTGEKKLFRHFKTFKNEEGILWVTYNYEGIERKLSGIRVRIFND